MHQRTIAILMMATAAGASGTWLGGWLAPLGVPSPFTIAPGTVAVGEPSSAAPATTAGTAPAEQPAQTVTAAPATFAAFDIVRAAPDGSLVLAGRATPNARIDIVANDKVIASVRSDLTGSFAAVLDQPLAPGDYSIGLVVTPPQGETVASGETAIVKIPDSPSGETLALIDQPGAPSIIIDAGNPALAAVTQAMAEAAAPVAIVAGDAAMAAAQTQATGIPQASPVAPPASEPAAAVEVAAAPAVAASPATSLTIEAVEVEGDKLFLAGEAVPGTIIRLYAGETLLGDVQTNGGGRWLFQGQGTLPQGDTTIRADVIGAGGSVVARAAVPFSRPAGDTFAAIVVPEPSLTLPDTPPTLAFKEVGGSVIIRRGDTLWQIARRVYGRGVRFSTIYSANAGQITDPDRIWPGQVFTVPVKSEEGEVADPEAMRQLGGPVDG